MSLIDIAKLDEGTLAFLRVENAAAPLHDLLGGYLEVVRLPGQNAFDGLIGLADEDGLAKPDYRVNFMASTLARRTIVGPFLVVRAKGSDFVDLTGNDRKFLADHLLQTSRLF